MIHPHTEVRFIHPDKGYGVVATKHIPRGTIVWIHDPLDRVIPKEELSRWENPWKNLAETYTYRNHCGDHVLCWDIAKYVNHSFRANCFSTAYDFELSVRDIAPGEELTDDYGFLNVEEPFHALSEGTERTVVYPDDLKTYHREWDAMVYEHIQLLETVEQPLKQFMDEALWQKAVRIARGEEQMKSLIHCYYEEE